MMVIKDVIKIEINKGKKRNIFKTLLSIYWNPSKNALFLYRMAKLMYDKGYRILPVMIKNRLIKRYGLHVSLKAEIGLGLEFKHVNGVVIGDGVTIGRNATIYQQVTLGGQNTGDGNKGNYPELGDNVIVFAGAKILGKVKIEDNVIIGANSVVLSDCEKDSVYAGVPAQRIKQVNT